MWFLSYFALTACFFFHLNVSFIDCSVFLHLPLDFSFFQSKFCSVHVWLHGCGLCDRITGPVGPCLFIQSGRLHWSETSVFKRSLWQLWQVADPHTHNISLSKDTHHDWCLCSIMVLLGRYHLEYCICTYCIVNILLRIYTSNVLLNSSALQSDVWRNHSCDGHPGRSEWSAGQQEAEDENPSSWSTSLCCWTPPCCSISLPVYHVCPG